MDADIIQGLLEWDHPYLSDGGKIQFTEEEKLAMIKLPRRECEYAAWLTRTRFTVDHTRFCHAAADT